MAGEQATVVHARTDFRSISSTCYNRFLLPVVKPAPSSAQAKGTGFALAWTEVSEEIPSKQFTGNTPVPFASVGHQPECGREVGGEALISGDPGNGSGCTCVSRVMAEPFGLI